ncbi:MAG: hypothetical protein JXA01_06850 [Dehalococcoidia bacterium]|nr:hypothetical protein [Dehalococcoidia bacterium]
MRKILVVVLMLVVAVAGCIYVPEGFMGPVAGGSQPPVAYIDSISPATPAVGETVNFNGHGTDADGTVVAYRWRSSISGDLGSSSSFSTILEPGNHVVYLKVQDNNGAWSDEVRRPVDVGGTFTPGTSSLPMINTFSASPATMTSGGSALLIWNVTGATSVSIDQGIGMVAAAGNMAVSPWSSTMYTLTASNSAGIITASTQVIVGSSMPSGMPVINSFQASPASILKGASTALTWDVVGATSISIDQGIGAVNATGSKSVSPVVSTSYTLTASNAVGWVSQSITVNVLTLAPLPVTPMLIKTTGALPNLSSERGGITKQGATYTKYSGACAGDTTSDGTRRGFLSFDISSIPSGSTIVEAILDLGGYTQDGSPTYATLGFFEVYYYQYGTYASLDSTDFNAAGTLVKGGRFSVYPLSPWKMNATESSTGQKFIQGLVDAHRTRSQYKVQFSNMTDGDGVLDFLCFNNATLTIKYTSP